MKNKEKTIKDLNKFMNVNEMLLNELTDDLSKYERLPSDKNESIWWKKGYKAGIRLALDLLQGGDEQ